MADRRDVRTADIKEQEGVSDRSLTGATEERDDGLVKITSRVIPIKAGEGASNPGQRTAMVERGGRGRAERLRHGDWPLVREVARQAHVGGQVEQ